MDLFFTSEAKVSRYFQAPAGSQLDGSAVLRRPGALSEGTPFFVGPDMRPLEPLCSYFFDLQKRVTAKSMADYAYDLASLVDFLAALDPSTDVLSASEDDLVAYRRHRTELQDSPVAPATWARNRASINGFYDWAVDAGLLPVRPYRKLRNGRDALHWGPRSELDVRHLTYRQWRHLHRVGLGGLRPDGGVDEGFRGGDPLRNMAAAELSVTTGMRLREFSSLLDIEVGAPRRDCSAAGIRLQAIAKRGQPRDVLIQHEVLTSIDTYRRTERAATVAGTAAALAARRGELFVVQDVDVTRMRVRGLLRGRRQAFAIAAMPAELRRIAVVDRGRGLEPMGLFVGRGGQILGKASDTEAAVSTACVSPAVWWPLLRAAWAYIHDFAPDLLDLRDRLKDAPQPILDRQEPLPPSAHPTSRTPAEVDILVTAWASDPDARMPVYDRIFRGVAAGTPAWKTLIMVITDGYGAEIFHDARGQARRGLLQALLDADRVQPINPIKGIRELGVTRKQRRRVYQDTELVDQQLRTWLADPGNLIPIRPSRAGAAGRLAWIEVTRRVWGADGRPSHALATVHPAGVRRRGWIQEVADTGRVEVLRGRGVHGAPVIDCAGFAVVTRPDGTSGPWRTTITRDELHWELLMIRAASYVFTAALSLMRDSELQEIERGALTTWHGAPAIRSRKIKHDPSRPHEHWWIIEPVAEALAVAERLSWHDSHVFASIKAPDEQRKSGRRGFPAFASIDFFIAGINRTTVSTGLKPIPPGLVRPHMFRRTMAVICGQEPDAEIALGLQLKHAARRALANRTTAGYYQADAAWIAEFDDSLELAAAVKLVDLLKGRAGGDAVAVGPGATRLHAGLDRVASHLRDTAADPLLRARLADPRLEVTLLRREFPELHWGTLNHCMFNAEQAECQTALPPDQRGQAPLIGACQPARCRNSIVTQSHAPIWLGEQADLLVRLRDPKLAAPRREAIQARLTDVQRITAALTPKDFA